MNDTARMNAQDKVILTIATTGAMPTRDNNPNIPLQPKEIADDVRACWKAGASVAHIHVRDDNERGTMALEKFRETVDRIRQTGCDIVLNLTTSGGPGTDEERMLPFMELKPELASFDAGSMNWMNNSLFINEPSFLEKLGTTMQEYGVKPEIEVFDMGMLNTAKYYIKQGIIKGPAHFQICLGAPAGLDATPESLIYVVNHLPEDCTWGTFGIGRGCNPVMLTALALGGGLRVGMEDNVLYNRRVLAQSNVQFVERVKRLAAEVGKTIATPDEARDILRLRR